MEAVDDDIRADFIAEAGELVQGLGEQLVELEKRPSDVALLNSIFRAFHTVKGGAGFLGLDAMVQLCHAAEDVFNLLRNGKRVVDAALMDVILQSSDQLQLMMNAVTRGAAPDAAGGELLAALRALAGKGEVPASKPSETKKTAKREAAGAKREKQKPLDLAPPAASASSDDAISEDEFDALLDQMAAEKKKAPVAVPAPVAPVSAMVPASEPVAEPAVPLPASRSPLSGGAAASAAAPETSVRVDTQRLDQMMNLTGELVLVRNRLKTLKTASGSEALAKAIAELDFITRGLQAAVMRIRMQPVRKVFSRFPKVARDVARGLGKQVEVELQGEDTDLDKNLVEALADPLVHMVRNAVDHGIEMPEVRTRAGKPAMGRLVLAASQQGDHILITVKDDGAGIDPDRLRTKVVEKGLMDAAVAARLSAEECLQLVFLPGFSTKEQISDLSGRGVGMDVVKSAITRLNGSVVIHSKLGAGSTVLIRVPLTLAILPALMVGVGSRLFALPLSAVCDVFVLDESSLRKLAPWDVVLVRDQPLRLVDLGRWADVQLPSGEPRHVVVAQAGTERYGFIVQQVRGREEVVIKPLGAMLRGLAGVSGATVTGEGRIALILDFSGLVQAAVGS